MHCDRGTAASKTDPPLFNLLCFLHPPPCPWLTPSSRLWYRSQRTRNCPACFWTTRTRSPSSPPSPNHPYRAVAAPSCWSRDGNQAVPYDHRSCRLWTPRGGRPAGAAYPRPSSTRKGWRFSHGTWWCRPKSQSGGCRGHANCDGGGDLKSKRRISGRDNNQVVLMLNYQ